MGRIGVMVAVVVAALSWTRPAAGERDLVIYGGTSGAVAAAVQASRMGLDVVIVCPETHLGGLSASGLGWTDSGDKSVIGGVSREFYRRVRARYDDAGAWRWRPRDGFGGYREGEDAMWVFEPHVAEAVFEAMIAEAGVEVFRDRWLDREGGVRVERGRIVSIETTGGERFEARVFIDATYEGDLMAAAGVSYTVGRESNATYGETLNGVQTARAVSHQFGVRVDPYVVPGDPSSGLVARVHGGDPGRDGEGDRRVQAYNYRVCLTDVPENRVPFQRPEGYDPAQYELLLRSLLAGSGHVFGKFDPIPNGKTDTNNHGAFSTDNIGMNYDYPEASYGRRGEILREHATYQKGYFYFLCNDPRVPAVVRERMSAWGLAADEFTDNGHWPHQIYVREARRMVSDFVMTERHVRGLAPTPEPVGMGSYNMDSHNTQRYVAHDERGAYVRNEGDVQVSPGGPYPIGYGAIVPARGECDNLLVPVCLSSSHIAYGSIRMEPVFMILGQSAATAAAIAIEEGATVQDVTYGRLRERLLADGQVLERAGARPRGLDPAALGGVVVDDRDATLAGAWAESTAVQGFVGRGYLHDGGAGAGCSAVFEAAAAEAGRHRVRLAYTPHANRAGGVRVLVEAGGERRLVRVDQREGRDGSVVWAELASVDLGAGDPVRVTVSNEGADGHVVIDAVQLLPAPRVRVEPVESPVGVSLRGLHVVDGRVAWASGAEGTWLRSVDGGATWAGGVVEGGETIDFRDVHGLGELEAVLMGTASPARLFRTDDGGETWALVHEDPSPDAFLDSLAFWDDRRGLVFGDPTDGVFTLLLTGDGGRSWRRVDRGALPAPLAGEAAFAASGTCIATAPDGRAWIGLGGQAEGRARALITGDFGLTWSVVETPLPSGSSRGVFSLSRGSAGGLVAVGGDYLEPELH